MEIQARIRIVKITALWDLICLQTARLAKPSENILSAKQGQAQSQINPDRADSICTYLATLTKEENMSRYADELQNDGAYLD